MVNRGEVIIFIFNNNNKYKNIRQKIEMYLFATTSVYFYISNILISVIYQYKVTKHLPPYS